MCNKDTVDNKVHIHKKLRNNHRDGKCKQCTIRNRLFKITQGTSPYIFLYLIVSQKNDKKAIFCRVISIYVFHIAAISCRELPFFRQFRFFRIAAAHPCNRVISKYSPEHMEIPVLLLQSSIYEDHVSIHLILICVRTQTQYTFFQKNRGHKRLALVFPFDNVSNDVIHDFPVRHAAKYCVYIHKWHK